MQRSITVHSIGSLAPVFLSTQSISRKSCGSEDHASQHLRYAIDTPMALVAATAEAAHFVKAVISKIESDSTVARRPLYIICVAATVVTTTVVKMAGQTASTVHTANGGFTKRIR